MSWGWTHALHVATKSAKGSGWRYRVVGMRGYDGGWYYAVYRTSRRWEP